MKKLAIFLFAFVLIWSTLLAGCGLTPSPSHPSHSPTPTHSLTPTHSPTPSPSPTPALDPPPSPGRNIVHYDGDPNTSMGMGGFADCLVYFNTAKLKSYIGCSLTGVQIYYAGYYPETFPYTVKLYNGVGGNATSPGTPLYSAEHIFSTGWNEVTLDTPIPIVNDLVIWAGFSLTRSETYGFWPISYDNLPAIPKTSYIRNAACPTWSEINANFNIRLVVEK